MTTPGTVRLTLTALQARTLLYAMDDYVTVTEDTTIQRWAIQLRDKLLKAGVCFRNPAEHTATPKGGDSDG